MSAGSDASSTGAAAPRVGRSRRGRNPDFTRQITEAILLHPELTPTQARVLSFLWLRYGDSEGTFFPSLKNVAKLLGMHERKLRGHIDNIEELGLVTKRRTVQPDGRFGSNALTLELDEFLDVVENEGSDARPKEVPQQFIASVLPITREPYEVARWSRETFGNPHEDEEPAAYGGPSVQRPMAGRTEPGLPTNQGEGVASSSAVADDADAAVATIRAREVPERRALVVTEQEGKVVPDPRQDVRDLMDDSLDSDRCHFLRTLHEALAQDLSLEDQISTIIEQSIEGDSPSINSMAAQIRLLLPQDPAVEEWLN